ncbi:AAA family ATPase [Rhodococcus sp. NPDC058505]|uniref:AAA family ATPase n=1 Tax=unclassified Rhodococcus (in: high G+C Gram-positive bacteria) TaxID=192944 RepID=UPI003656CC24
MRLHDLEVTAFGPFGDTVTVDFDELGADGLFLLHGQTGAGKTTILDAVAFALYGRVPGARQEGKRLLSDHAAPGTPPRVVLEATIGGRRLRITRSPEYQRPKLRGTGTTKENAKATLEWLDGRGENLTRLDEIGDAVGRLLGMSADQFFQVVLLPQGDFARFLRADTEERGVLLERLFDTGRFATVEEWFAERRREAEAAVSGTKTTVDRIAAQVSAAAGIEAGADADPVAWAGRLVDESREAADAASTVLATARATAERTEHALGRAREVRQSQDRAARAKARLAELATGQSARELLAAERDRAVRAVPVATAEELAVAAAGVAGRERARTEDLASVVRREPEGAALLERVSWPAAPDDAQVLAAAVRGWSAEVARLGELIRRDEQRRSARRDQDAAHVRRDELITATATLESRRAEIPAEVERADAELMRARAAAASLPALTTQCEATRERLTAARELGRVRARRAAAADRHRRARDTHLDAREVLATVREQRIAGMAAELAAGLATAAPCPVCGSDEHPTPARPAADAVSKSDEDDARVVEQTRAGELEAATAALADLDRTAGVLADRVGDADADALAAAATAADAARSAAEATAATLATAEAAVARLRAESEDLAARAQRLSADLAALEQRIADGAARLAELDRAVEDAIGGESDLQARHDRLGALADAATALRDQRAAAASAAVAAADAADRAARASSDAGFVDLPDARSAARTGERIAEIDAILAAAAEERLLSEAVLADPAVVEAVRLGPADVPAAEAADAAAREGRDAAAAAATTADARAAKVEHYALALTDEVAALGPALRRYEELAALAEVIAGRGQNARKMSLRSYVLAARLEEVALSASVRLRRMSGGRYEFVHEDGAGPRGKRGGLGLDIRDDYTGVVRSAKTLSGGESFLASLALALGLADVVAAESGGLVLDTMFIDEGFGTLDADTLEAVMGVLDELREGGRVVGIVSHVDEMRQRIPSRLHVLRGRAGSTLEVVA